MADDIEDRHVQTRTDGVVGHVVFDNPSHLNAMSYRMATALPDALMRLDSDDAVRVIVMTGAGDRSFMSGADISEFKDRQNDPGVREVWEQSIDHTLDALDGLRKPVIARINGYCIGTGLVVALRADLRVAITTSKFGIPAGRIGLGFGPRGVEPLLRAISAADASDILLTARHVDAAEALEMGLVHTVVDVSELDSTVDALAQRIAANAPLTMQACKMSIRHSWSKPTEVEARELDDLVESCYTSDDYREGTLAFAERRTPVFRGR
jgi:enoyl-CoA hydratase